MAPLGLRHGAVQQALIAPTITPDLQMLENSTLGQSMKFCPFNTRSHALNDSQLCVQHSFIYCSLRFCKNPTRGVGESNVCGIAIEVSTLEMHTPKETKIIISKDGMEEMLIALLSAQAALYVLLPFYKHPRTDGPFTYHIEEQQITASDCCIVWAARMTVVED